VQDIVDKSSAQNNKIRNENLQNQLEKLKLEIFEKVDSSIRDRMEHATASPATQREFNKINITCAERGRDLANMDEKIDSLCSSMEAISTKMNKNVSWSIFWSIIILLVGLFAGVIGYQSSKISDLENGRNSNSQNIVMLKTQTEQILIILHEIKQEIRK